MSFSDLFILANNGSFSELEQEKSMPNGGILRQCLRLSRKLVFCSFENFNKNYFPSDDSRCS